MTKSREIYCWSCLACAALWAIVGDFQSANVFAAAMLVIAAGAEE